MKNPSSEFFIDYADRLQSVLKATDWHTITPLVQEMKKCWIEKRQVFICGNGGSAANAIHWANDFVYGVAKRTGAAMRMHALSANPAVITCLGNDLGYDHIYSEQLAVLGQPGDLLIVLSGSGNSSNIIAVLEQARNMGIKSHAIVGFSGGRCKTLADTTIHFPVFDMQIAEDLQLIVGHMIMQWLYENRTTLTTSQEDETLYA
jgi:D-sedoheptulose 7-phosphate isomerase